MKKLLNVILLCLIFNLKVQAQCTTTNATTCNCLNGTSNCDLLPDIKVSEKLLSDPMWNTEYSQTGNGSNNGQLRITVATPNIGRGPLTVMASGVYVCGTDTIWNGAPPLFCPDGTNPKNIINQRIYHKNGNVMTYTDDMAGSMTYHNSHLHMHVDDWGIFTLRLQTPDPNPLNWPIVGQGSKIAFCLMDLGTCDFYDGNCVSDLNDTLFNADFPNFGLGGGNYNCSPSMQGISSGYVDVYDQSLDGMYIDIPPGTCNGDYWIVAQIDPNNNFQEENENNNVMAVPITLTEQATSGTQAIIVNKGNQTLCDGETTLLSASPGFTYLWSNGETTQSIIVSSAGSYMVTVDNYCGLSTSNPYTINAISVSAPAANNVSFVAPATVTLNASGSGDLRWYNAPTGGTLLHTGPSYTTPVLNNTATYHVANSTPIVLPISYMPPHDKNIGMGSFTSDPTRYLIFDVHKKILLKSVKVYSSLAGNRIIQLRDSAGIIKQSLTVWVDTGETRITLNMTIDVGNSYKLGTGGSSNFFRSVSGVQYPYSIADVVDIIGSSNGSVFYYFFYDWEVDPVDPICESARIPVVASNLAASINENNAEVHVNIFPNPIDDELKVQSEHPITEVLITDATGKTLSQEYIPLQPTATIEAGQLATGTYIVVVVTAQGTYRKLVSKR
ncbi:MAG: T9SS type A sorting domain-containing protein [Bacteroidetes bacterium]|nr:T9SS type A sorting domain-containing protein [Bacteroidota bacterium]